MTFYLYPLLPEHTRFVLFVLGKKEIKRAFWDFCKGPGIISDTEDFMSLSKILPLPSSVDTGVSISEMKQSIWGVPDTFIRQEKLSDDRLSFVSGGFPDKFYVMDFLSKKFPDLVFYLEYVYLSSASSLITRLQGIWVYSKGSRIVNVGCSDDFADALMDCYNYLTPHDTFDSVLSSKDLVMSVMHNMKSKVNLMKFHILQDEIFLNYHLQVFGISRPAHRHTYAYERLQAVYDELSLLCPDS